LPCNTKKDNGDKNVAKMQNENIGKERGNEEEICPMKSGEVGVLEGVNGYSQRGRAEMDGCIKFSKKVIARLHI